MIPILMGVFALGGTTYGMAEESRAFYALVITVTIATGYDAGRRRRGPARRSGHRHLVRAALRRPGQVGPGGVDWSTA